MTLKESRYKQTWRFGLLHYKARPLPCFLICLHADEREPASQSLSDLSVRRGCDRFSTHICLQSHSHIQQELLLKDHTFFFVCFCQLMLNHISMPTIFLILLQYFRCLIRCFLTPRQASVKWTVITHLDMRTANNNDTLLQDIRCRLYVEQ